MAQAHHEINFEAYIAQKLTEQGWLEGTSDNYDKQRALYPEDVIAWIQTTQPEQWSKLETLNGSDAANVVLERLAKSLEANKSGGTINVFRQGFKIAGVGQIEMSQIAPEDARNEAVLAKYKANRLRVVRQLKYCPVREWSIDLVFFINGLPVATVEVKTDFTQSVDDAIEQYKKDRHPVDPQSKRKESLLTFKRGAVVHFAMSDSEIYMATKLDGENSYFLPFNKGNNGRAGNAARADGEYPVAYFWEQICQSDAWLRIFHSFVYMETADKVNAQGKPYKKETLIFPRYHQWEAVNLMIDDARKNGVGLQYLCEHSAGSGKTSTIAWISHDLIRLRTPDGKPYFDSVIIVTDRNVLDAQLQEAVQQIDHQFGVINAIDRQHSNESKSKQLAKALLAGTPIIIVTIQTFPYAMQAILTEQTLSNKKFAVIIDEAHNSQTGSTAQGLRAALTLSSKQDMGEMTVEELLEQVQQSRVRPDNVSYFAFTATPKHSTMTLFGRDDDEGLPQSFHRYTMRQAIDEGFILDVLQNYTPYKTALHLQSQIEDDHRVDKKQARKALAKWLSLHPTNVTQKVEFIIEHFRANVSHLLNGEAKAMVVTSSRAAAVKYKMAFDKFIEQHGYQDVRALVAFSGKITGNDLTKDTESTDPNGSGGVFIVDPDDEFTERSMNPEIGSQDLRNAFDTHEYRVMLVANKFQTGFNQPKLVAMYLDKKISGIEAVQTMSRLNRTYPGKDQTFVIDFVNEPATIRAAFAQYDEGTVIEEVQDLDVVYDLQSDLNSEGIYDQSDLNAFKQARFKSLKSGEVTPAVHRQLYAATQRPTDVFNAKLKSLKETVEQWEATYQKAYRSGDEKGMGIAEHKRSEYTKAREDLMLFKARLTRFSKVYGYIAQLIDFADPELENFAAFSKLLAKRLDGVTPDQVDLSGLVLSGLSINPIDDGEEESEGENGSNADISVKPLIPDTSEAVDREKEFLNEIIARINNIFGDLATSDDQASFTTQIAKTAFNNDVVTDQIEKNPKNQVLQGDLPKEVAQAVIQAMAANDAMARVLLNDKQCMSDFVGVIYDLVKSKEPNKVLGL